MIRNPVIPGFAPDPSVVRVGEDYYLATSTFEWFPGIALYHARDLMHWRLIGHALTRRSQLDLRGVPDSGGVWAPSLSHADGRFWLVFGVLRNTGLGRPFKDIRVCLVTAEHILGPWSEPVELDGIGFDPSLFHDDDGRKWVLNIEWDFRKGRHRFAGIVAQQYDPQAQRLVGARHKILSKTVLTEGPNVYKRDGWYYLMMAEGGTGWNHGISMARARGILGPYELDPQAAVLTSRDDYGLALQRAGHGELVQTPAGQWYLAHLAGRPITPERRCVLGRETCLQQVHWSEDAWLRLDGGGHHPRQTWPAPAGITARPQALEDVHDDFSGPALAPHWQSLRVPAQAPWVSLSERPGWLRLRGHESLHSMIAPNVLARRLRGLRAVASTQLAFRPDHYTQMAGLLCIYNSRQHLYLRVTHDEGLGVVLGLTFTRDGQYDEPGPELPIGHWPEVHLQARLDHAKLQFAASADGRHWQDVGGVHDLSLLSDEVASGFTGTLVGICAQDLGGLGTPADFKSFSLVHLGHSGGPAGDGAA